MEIEKDAFRPSVNGLRGIAVLMVVLYHWSHIRGGFTGVDVFFVISGYLISGHIVRDLCEGRFSFAGFYAKRTRRIVPTLALILIFALALGWFRSFDDQFRLLGKHVESGALFVSNFRLYGESTYFDVAAETKPLLHLWSLAIEEQFYLIWPVLLWAAFRASGRIRGVQAVRAVVVLVSLLSFAANLYLSSHNTEMDFYLLPSRLWELAFGYLVLSSRTRLRAFYDSAFVQVAGLFLILYGFVTIRGQTGFPGAQALIPVIGAGLILGASEAGLVNRTVLSSRFLGFFGTLSYTFYLWHWPLFSFMKSLMLNDSMGLLAVSALLLSYLTHRFVEKPLMRYPVTAGNRVRIVAAGFAVLAAIAFAGALIGNGTIHGRMKTASLPNPVDPRNGRNCGVDGGYGNVFYPDALKPCEAKQFPGGPVILLVGDSHASSLLDGMDAFAKENRVNLVTFTAVYCVPLSDHDRRPACRDFNRYLGDWVARVKPDLVVVDAYHLFWSKEGDYSESIPYADFVISKLTELKKATGKEVLLIGQNPTWQISLTRVLDIAFLAKGEPVPERTFQGIEPDSLRMDRTMKDEASRQGLPYFSIQDEICTVDGCRVRVGERLESDLMEFDYGHLSHRGSLYVLENGLGARIKALLR